jgi:hypothetical protein
MDSTVLLASVVFAGRVHDHGLLEVRDQAGGVSVIVVSVGNAGDDVTVKVIGNGKVVPLLGAMGNEYVAVLPGSIVAEVPVPLPDKGVPRLMSITASETVLLGPAERKFASPL